MAKFLIPAAALLAAALVVGGCSGSDEPTQSIRVAHAQFETTALVLVADDQGFFADNGLSATLDSYDTGAGALEEVLNGEADLAVGTAEFPLVGKAFQKKRLRALASISETEFIYLVGRRDRGIEKIADLAGKRVGTTRGTIAEFYLGRLLELNNMSMQDVILVDIKTPATYGDAVVNGDVDAVVTAQPHANSVRDRLGENAAVWSAQSGQPVYALVIAAEEWTEAHGDLSRKFLNALAEAETYVLDNPGSAKAIVQKRLNLDPDYMDTVWSQNFFSLSLDQALIVAMEDEARWMIKNGLTSETAMPDFLEYISDEGLRVVRPDAVHVIQ